MLGGKVIKAMKSTLIVLFLFLFFKLGIKWLYPPVVKELGESKSLGDKDNFIIKRYNVRRVL